MKCYLIVIKLQIISSIFIYEQHEKTNRNMTKMLVNKGANYNHVKKKKKREKHIQLFKCKFSKKYTRILYPILHF